MSQELGETAADWWRFCFWQGARMNKRKKVAWHKHLKSRKKAEEKRRAAPKTR
jgi:hypothetical protein